MIKYSKNYLKGRIFMGYELLSKIYYKNKDIFETEFAARKNRADTISLGFQIGDYEAFYVNHPEFALQMARLYKKFAQLEKLCAVLPGVAYKFYERNCLIDEIIITNDIEGIRSTRKEIISVMETDEHAPKKGRFAGLVEKYMFLENGSAPYEIALETSQDVRNLYDEIVLAEIEKPNWPDGEIFRKDLAEVISGTQQVKHKGVYPEQKIIEYIDQTLALFKRQDILNLHKVAILHYMIGYVHPFYDGNGRLSRFLSSYLLKKEFNTLTALRLAYTIKENKSEYYKAFDICNNGLNRGELTYFLIYFSEVVERSIDSLIEKLEEGRDMLNAYRKALKIKYDGCNENERRRTIDVLWFLIQNAIFSNEPLGKSQLAGLLRVGVSAAHSYVMDLINSGVPIAIEKEGRKLVYKLEPASLLEFLRS
ncbi:Fic family protein [Emergencia sp. 1XD21-10]|nr:Fic family protein [Emergencia sp. 1XD21-10]